VSAFPWKLTATFVGGFLASPLLSKLLLPLLAEVQKRRESAAAAREVVARQLDPLLKAADELQAKLRSLAEEDFAEFRRMPDAQLGSVDLVNLCSTLYLIAQFWGRLELLRQEAFHVELARNRQGKMLQDFLRCLESRRVRLVDRAWQRAIGESVITTDQPASRVFSFRSFVEQYETSPRLQVWMQPLRDLLRETKYRRARQRMLQYGVIIHSLIDTLDPKHYTTKYRPPYPNKLTKRAKRELIGRVFGVYLVGVRRPEKYTGSC
jgi:hypothetical protein